MIPAKEQLAAYYCFPGEGQVVKIEIVSLPRDKLPIQIYGVNNGFSKEGIINTTLYVTRNGGVYNLDLGATVEIERKENTIYIKKVNNYNVWYNYFWILAPKGTKLRITAVSESEANS